MISALQWERRQPSHLHVPSDARRCDDNESELEFLDAAGDDVSTLATTRVITGATIIGRVDVRLDYTILIHPDGDNDTDIALTPAHIAAIRRSRGQTEVRIGDDGYGDCEYLITIKPDGTGKIGDEVISRKDLLALYNAIGESIEG